ncbi:MAG TPA: hypothetical protein VFM55_19135 [Micromonosporaceae bacterium]|nr:hypothetical protein [Micromonosporaceae bacterium]
MTTDTALARPAADPASVPPLPVIHEPRRPADPPARKPIEVICDLTRATHETQMRLDAGNGGRITAEETETITALRDLLTVVLESTPDQRQRMRPRVREAIGESGRRLAALDRRTAQAERWAEDNAWDEMRRLKYESEGWEPCAGDEG